MLFYLKTETNGYIQSNLPAFEYQIKETQNQRWGIYLQDRLLATIGNYEVGLSLWRSLSENLSDKDSSKAMRAHDKALAKL